MTINIEDLEPVTREERFVASALGLVDASDLEPVTRVEAYLKAIAESGGTGGGTGASTASQVSYSTIVDSNVTNVKKALDKLYATVYYVAPSISSFTTTPTAGTYEIGQTISSVTFNWSYNKDIASQSLTDCSISVDDRTATYSKAITSNKTFTLSASDGTKSVSSNKAFTFTNKVWYGSSAIGTYDDSFILGLATGKLQTNKNGTYTVNVGNNEYFFIAMPTSYNNSDELVGKIGGFETSFNKVATINHTNANGYATNYNIYKSGNHSLGSVSFII